MKKLFFKLLHFYNFFITTAILAYGIAGYKSLSGLILLSLFGGLEISHIASYFSKTKSNQTFLTILKIYSFIVSLFIFVVTLIGAKTPLQIFSTLLILPIVIDCTLNFLHVFQSQTKIKIKPEVVEEGTLIDPDFQIEKRKFLKMFVGTSAGMLLLYLFNPKKANAAFFGSLPGPGIISIKDATGTVIDPSTKNPFDGFGINDVDEASSTHYYGFVHYNGTDWYVLKETSGGVYSYASKLNNAASIYSAGWTNRAGSLVYGTASDAF